MGLRYEAMAARKWSVTGMAGGGRRRRSDSTGTGLLRTQRESTGSWQDSKWREGRRNNEEGEGRGGRRFFLL
eukprot:753882-Hanusia_phi.AAC.4